MSTDESLQFSEAVVRRRPFGIYLFTLTYALVALIALLGILAFIPEARANADLYNPWDTAEGPIVAAASLAVLVSSIGAFRGSRLGRACLTASLGVILVGALIGEIWAVSQLRGIANCSSQPSCALSEWWNLDPSPVWALLFAWLVFHCWYFFGPRTRVFYMRAQDA